MCGNYGKIYLVLEEIPCKTHTNKNECENQPCQNHINHCFDIQVWNQYQVWNCQNQTDEKQGVSVINIFSFLQPYAGEQSSNGCQSHKNIETWSDQKDCFWINAIVHQRACGRTPDYKGYQ